MKKIISSIFICFSFQLACFAQYVEKDVAKGMILNYEVQEAKINYKLKATVQEWNSNGNVKIQWQTSGAKKMKGVTTFPFESLDKASEMKVKLKPGNEQLTNGAIRWFAPNNYFDELFNDLGFVTATIDDNEVHLNNDEYEYETNVTYDGQSISLSYANGYSSETDSTTSIDFIQFEPHVIIMSYYSRKGFVINLTSIQSSAAKPAVKQAINEVKPKKADDKAASSTTPRKQDYLQKMEPKKFAKVKSKYPLLASIENYDLTNGGTLKKSNTETYDFRNVSGMTNPPSLVDCLTADLKIIYDQRKNFGITDIETISNKSFPSSAAKKLLDVYVNYEYAKIPGYRALTNRAFVTSLSENERIKLAKDLEGYIAEYGFSE